jgi:hypothetical protein
MKNKDTSCHSDVKLVSMLNLVRMGGAPWRSTGERLANIKVWEVGMKRLLQMSNKDGYKLLHLHFDQNCIDNLMKRKLIFNIYLYLRSCENMRGQGETKYEIPESQ